MKQFPPLRDYSSLSIKDLLDARDAYHVHLSHLTNVIATAIGRYRIRHDDWYATNPPGTTPPEGTERPTYARTLTNSVVTDWSWPCVLVFVSEWAGQDKFSGSPDQMVPRALFLPDGRVVPTCVVLAKPSDAPRPQSDHPSFPANYIGGGYLVRSEVQGRPHYGSIGCLVSDGTEIYALTNRHVTGEPGREISTFLEGNLTRVGVSAQSIGKKPFEEVYRGWAGTNVEANLDAGLIRVDDVASWTTQVYSLGQLAAPVDLNTDTMTLDLIDRELAAYGAASGRLRGKVYGLFYRYKSLAGEDYTCDFLIGPADKRATDGSNDEPPQTRPGDSGTLWCMLEGPADKPIYRPIALQWGGHLLLDDNGDRKTPNSFALATAFSTICRELDVDLVRDWNVGLPESWGDIGHYTIGLAACRLVKEEATRELFQNNEDRISMPEESLHPKDMKQLDPDYFVPLADVPDKVWKIRGAKGARRQAEHANHFADMDKPSKAFDGRTLLQICEDEKQINVETWIRYYDDVGEAEGGLLPFRVQQLFEEMVTALEADSIAGYLAAGGIMAHYVGDACQPLHISYKHDGDPADWVWGKDRQGNRAQVPRAHGVHSAYETNMVNTKADFLLNAINTLTGAGKIKAPVQVTSGHAAAVEVVRLMRRTYAYLAPDTIIAAYLKDHSSANMWKLFKDKTADLMADGAQVLAVLWDSAWKLARKHPADLGEVDEPKLMKLYRDPSWCPSYALKEIGPHLKRG